MKNKQASLASVHLYRLKNISNIQASWCQHGPLRPQRFIAGTCSHITKSTVLNDDFRVLTCTGPHVFLVAILEGLGVVSLQPGNLRQRQLGVVSATFSPVSCWVNCRNNKGSNWNNFCRIPMDSLESFWPSIYFFSRWRFCKCWIIKFQQPWKNIELCEITWHHWSNYINEIPSLDKLEPENEPWKRRFLLKTIIFRLC